jgi:FAD-linked sulfhydryl oxidase
MKTGPHQTSSGEKSSNENHNNTTSSSHSTPLNQGVASPAIGLLHDESAMDKKECPLDKEELGTKTWGFLHTMSVYLPEGKLETTQQTELTSFIDLFSKFYPCDICATDMRKDIKDEKPTVQTGNDFAQWLCRLHNKTNLKLGKPVFDCNKVFERWKHGPEDGSCD